MTAINLSTRIRLVNDDGTLTPEAYRSLVEIVNRTGGALGSLGSETFVASDSSAIDAQFVMMGDTFADAASFPIFGEMTEQPGSIDAMGEMVMQPLPLSVTDISDTIHAATNKVTPVDSDELALVDSDLNFSLKRLTWANVKATLKTYFDTLYLGVSATAANASMLLGATWAAPGNIGATTPASGSFTTATANSFKSFTASASTATGVATTVYTLANAAPAVHLVSANIGAVGDANNYSSFAVVVSDGSTARLALTNNGALQTITLSGLALQTTQSSGATQTANFTITRIG